MDTELKLDLEAAKKLTGQTHKYNFKKLLVAPVIDSNAVIQEIVTKYQNDFDKYIKPIADKIRKLQTELNQIQTKIDNTQQQLQDIQERQKLIPQIEQKFKVFSSFFPESIPQAYITADFHNLSKILTRTRNRLGFFAKLSFNRKEQQITKLHNELCQLMSQAGIAHPTDSNINSVSHQSELRSLTRAKDEKVAEITKLKDTFTQSYTAYSNDMHTEVGAWLHTYDTRTDLRKNTPPMINMQGLTEPVSFFQIITGITEKQLTDLLKHAGLHTGYDASQYIVRPARTILGHKCLELITHFYSPQHARQNILTLMQYLAEHGAQFEGFIKPATYSQINPKPSQPTKLPQANILPLIQQKLNGPNTITLETFRERYSNTESPQYLFRGQTFITSDPSSSYATPTWRPGRTGLPYATTDATSATGYATAPTNLHYVTGRTMNTAYLLSVNNYTVGFVTVFQNSKRNIMTTDRGLEDLKDKRHLKHETNAAAKTSFHETAVSPHNNPIVARYMIVGDKMVLIDDQDAQWREIMDAMAPDLKMTHTYGANSNHAAVDYTQSQHGLMFINRILSISNPPQTYDIPDNIMQQLGYKKTTNAEKFQAGSARLLNTSNMHNHTIPTSNEHD